MATSTVRGKAQGQSSLGGRRRSEGVLQGRWRSWEDWLSVRGSCCHARNSGQPCSAVWVVSWDLLTDVYECSSEEENVIRRPACGDQRAHICHQTRPLGP